MDRANRKGTIDTININRLHWATVMDSGVIARLSDSGVPHPLQPRCWSNIFLPQNFKWYKAEKSGEKQNFTPLKSRYIPENNVTPISLNKRKKILETTLTPNTKSRRKISTNSKLLNF